MAAIIQLPWHPLVAPEMREQTLAVMNRVLEALKAAFPEYIAAEAVIVAVAQASGGPFVKAGVVEFAVNHIDIFQFVAQERIDDTYVFSTEGQAVAVTPNDANGIVQWVRGVYENGAQ